jgi:hypothetical protein
MHDVQHAFWKCHNFWNSKRNFEDFEKLNAASERFDGLFALTSSLNNYDYCKYWFDAIFLLALPS